MRRVGAEQDAGLACTSPYCLKGGKSQVPPEGGGVFTRRMNPLVAEGAELDVQLHHPLYTLSRG